MFRGHRIVASFSSALRFLGLMALGIALAFSTSLMPIRSQSPSATPISQEFIRIFAGSPPLEMQRGKDLYQAGRFAEAAAFWEAAAQAWQDDPVNLALALNYLSLARQQLGQWQAAQQAIAESLEAISQIGSTHDRTQVLARALSTQARLQLTLGQEQAALENLQRASEAYNLIGDRIGAIGTRVNQAQVLQQLGRYRQAWKLLDGVRVQLAEQPPEIQATGWLSLGNTLRAIGDFQQSWETLQNGLTALDGWDRSTHEMRAQFFLSLGDTAQALGDREKLRQPPAIGQDRAMSDVFRSCRQGSIAGSNALGLYRQSILCYDNSAKFTHSSNTRIYADLHRAQVNLKILDTREWQPQWSESARAIARLQPQIRNTLPRLASGQTIASARIQWARNELQFQKWQDRHGGEFKIEATRSDDPPEMESMLKSAISTSQALDDKRTIAQANGYLGQFYEWQRNWTKAAEYTRKAIAQSDRIEAIDLAYQWQWQLGRILKQSGRTEAAIAAYQNAINSLQDVRQALVSVDLNLEAIHSELPFDFQDRVEPVYREFIDLLLASDRPDSLPTAVAAIELFRLAELESFLKCDLPNKFHWQQPIKQVGASRDLTQEKLNEIHRRDPKAAVVYPLLLKDRIATIIAFPDGSLDHFIYPVDGDKAEQVFYTLRQDLEGHNPAHRIRRSASLVYEWLLAAAESQLEKYDIETLVFVPDGSLRNIPMAALYDKADGEYLVERYGIALLPRLLQLDLDNSEGVVPSILPAGSTNASPPEFPEPIPSVAQEVQRIRALMPGRDLLLDRDFTWSKLQQHFVSSSPGGVHIATHGKFSSDPKRTYLIDYKNARLSLDGFSEFFRLNHRKLDLLVLSACETAQGDNRAILGLAGIAIQSGARSTIAGLWQIDDTSTVPLMIRFYEQLKRPGNTKVQALRHAQVESMSDRGHPSWWAPYVIVGNWR